MSDLLLNLATLKRVYILEITGFSKSVDPKAERTANHSYWIICHLAKKKKKVNVHSGVRATQTW